MDDLMFSTMMPQKKLGGKFRKEPESNSDCDLSVVFLGEEDHHCENCGFKSKNKTEVTKHNFYSFDCTGSFITFPLQ